MELAGKINGENQKINCKPRATAELARILPRCSVIINEHRQQVGRINSLPVFYISIIPVVERKFRKL